MTKILCVGDIHARDRAPRGAQEPYMEDLLELLRQTVAIAKERAVDAVVWAGDVFHEKEPRKTSHATVQRMIEIVQSHGDIPLYIVPGNHDVSNSRLDSIDEKQPLGVLYRTGALRLEGWVEGLPIYGIPWPDGDWNDTELSPEAPLFKEWRDRSGEKSLLVTHASLYPLGTEPPFDVLDIEKFSEAVGAGSVYYGHIHEDHGVFTVGKTQFANMGALSRGSRHEYNIQRDIKVCIWEDGNFEEIVLDYRPAEDFMLLDEKEEEKKAKMDLDSFIQSIGTKAMEISSTASVIEYISTREDVEPPVRKRAIDLLETLAD